ncbi:glycosyltransferase [Sphingomonas sp. PAMC 26621]|uniref:glycosyltransferase n=1 Tax=Sphingomonas sp. PAMC 26621 TaxID=1112213 RepID=UPI00028846B0|nr:glycosyltransferase [Sphingomonas sp. PAMC 26621]
MNNRGSATTLLLVLPLPIWRCDGILYLDTQALNGLRMWLKNFNRLILCVPQIEVGSQPVGTSRWDGQVDAESCQLFTLPNRRTIFGFLIALPGGARLLTNLINRSSHLHFAIGGLAGDWAAIGALIARYKQRRAAIWTDRVESQVTHFQAQEAHGLKRAYRLATSFVMKHFERFVIKRSSLGLLHGADCYEAYAQFSPCPQLVHNIHLSPAARIKPDVLARKVSAITESRPLRILYAGRAHGDKGVRDWIDTLHLAAQHGVVFQARWLGDGPKLAEARSYVEELGLQNRISFPGHSSDREAFLAELQAADVFLFCHQTSESPRCLIEALLSGTPIVGYASSYPEDLISKHAGGVLTKKTPEALAAALSSLSADRPQLRELVVAASRDGAPFTDEDVFRHRAELMKTYA